MSSAVDQSSFLRHAKVISALTLVSRIFGMIRETALATFLGAGVVATAFRVAFAVPNLFRKLFGEGALSAAFIPLYSQALKEQSPEEARRFAAASVNLLTAILVAITIIGEAILISLIIFADPQRLSFILMLKLSAIMLPYVVLICLTAFLSAILQTHRYFAMPAFAPVLLNIIHIAVTAFGGWLLGITVAADDAEKLQKQTTLAWWLAAFVVIAGVAQILVLVPSLRRVGFRFSLRQSIWIPPVRRMLVLSIPVALAAGVLQISVLMDKGISAFLAQDLTREGQLITHFSFFGRMVRYPMELGAVPRLDMAQVLYQFPLGIFAIAIATAIFPSLSSDALERDGSRFNSSLRTGIEATLFEGFAASVGLIIVRYPVVRLLLQYGAMTEHDVALIAKSLCIYSSAIWAYSMQQIINRAYYALHDTKTPFVMSVVNIVMNLVIELPLLWTPLGEAAMAAGTACSFAAQSVIMLLMLCRRIGDFGLRQISLNAAKMLIAAGVMYAVCHAVTCLPFYPSGGGKKESLLQLAILISTGAISYLGVSHLLGLRMMWEMLAFRRGEQTRA